MAHGVLLLMIGDATKKRDELQQLKKTYEFSVLFGVETDTYDVMGILKSLTPLNLPTNLIEKIQEHISHIVGLHTQQYPPYSSISVNGKSLYWYAKNDLLHTITIPKKTIQIYSAEFVKTAHISALDLQKNIIDRISKTHGDFRQEEIIECWNQFFTINHELSFALYFFTIECSSGTYVRSIVHELGQFLNCGAIAYEIYRTKVGEYKIDEAIKI
jgi:tRNA pseudouridine55 synthase